MAAAGIEQVLRRGWTQGISGANARVYCGGIVRLPMTATPEEQQRALEQIAALATQATIEGWAPDPSGALEIVETRSVSGAELIVHWRFPHLPIALIASALN